MSIISTIIFLSIAVAMDAFAVSLGVGSCCEVKSNRGKARLAAHFGIFQSGMTALGWLTGDSIIKYIEKFDHWIALVLLGYVGIKLITAGLSDGSTAFDQDPSTGKTMVMLSFATSIDAFAVGLSLVALHVPVFATILSIGIVTAGFSAAGLLFGYRLGETFGKKMEVVGGIVLILIGIRVVFSHIGVEITRLFNSEIKIAKINRIIWYNNRFKDIRPPLLQS